MPLSVSDDAMPRTKIEPDSPVEVLFTPRERDLVVEETFAGPNLTKRLKLAVRYTFDDLDELVGYVAAAANHTRDEALQDELDELFERLKDVMESYDDGGGRGDHCDATEPASGAAAVSVLRLCGAQRIPCTRRHGRDRVLALRASRRRDGCGEGVA